MKQKIIIGIMILFIVAVVVFMAKDLFVSEQQIVNPYEYNIDDFKGIDSSEIGYKELKRFSPTIQQLKTITVDGDDNIYLAGLQKVMIYNKDYEFQSGFRIQAEAQAVNVSSNKMLFLGIGDHVEIWNLEGIQQSVWKPFNERSYITSIAIKGDKVFVADAGNKIILKYNVEGELLNEIGKKDTAQGIKGFVIPSPYFDLLIGRQGELWAVNSGLHQFEAYNEQGELFSSWKRTSMQWDGFSGCCNPSNIAMLSDGSFVTSEKGLVRIKIHAPSGDFKCAVATPDEFDENTKGIDLAVDSRDRIIAIIPNTGEVRVYERK